MANSGIQVGVIGFSESEKEKLKRIFQYSKSRPRSFAAGDPSSDSIDILMVNIDADEAEGQRQEFLQKHPDTPVVTAGEKQPANDSNYHIKRPLLSTRVLKVLEQVKLAEHEVEAARPAEEQNQTVESVEATPEPTESSQAGDTYDVLVVDDSPSMQKALEIELGQVPMTINIDFADTGEQALERIGQKQYHFIFLDIMMPGIDGYETCTTIRKNPEMKKTPIIMLSAKTSPLDEVKGVMAGCTTYLTKPIVREDFQKLIKRITEWLENFQQKQ